MSNFFLNSNRFFSQRHGFHLLNPSSWPLVSFHSNRFFSGRPSEFKLPWRSPLYVFDLVIVSEKSCYLVSRDLYRAVGFIQIIKNNYVQILLQSLPDYELTFLYLGENPQISNKSSYSSSLFASFIKDLEKARPFLVYCIKFLSNETFYEEHGKKSNFKSRNYSRSMYVSANVFNFLLCKDSPRFNEFLACRAFKMGGLFRYSYYINCDFSVNPLMPAAESESPRFKRFFDGLRCALLPETDN